MSNEMVAILLTSLISLASLIISINNYLINKPKLKIIISNKECDAYFGDVCARDDKKVPTNVAALEINIVNNSPVDIFIKEIKLKTGKDIHRLVDNSNSFWEECYFFYYNDRGEKDWDGTSIDYGTFGIRVPTTVKSYTILSGICLFHDFPNVSTLRKCGKVVLNSAVGKIEKWVKFRKFDSHYISSAMKDVRVYLKNLK